MAADPRFATWANALEDHLDQALPPAGAAPQRLHAAMRHAVQRYKRRQYQASIYIHRVDSCYFACRAVGGDAVADGAKAGK